MRIQRIAAGWLWLVLPSALLPTFLIAVQAGDKADFNGQWVLSQDKRTRPEQRMKVTQNGDKLEVETTTIVNGKAYNAVDSFIVDGKEVEIEMHQSASKHKGKRRARWNADGNGFEAHDVAVYDTPGGTATLTVARKWTLSADGKTLVIELIRTDATDTSSSKRTFNKE